MGMLLESEIQSSIELMFDFGREPEYDSKRVAEYNLTTLSQLAFWHAMRNEPLIGDACGNALIDETMVLASEKGLGIDLEKVLANLSGAHNAILLKNDQDPTQRYFIRDMWS